MRLDKYLKVARLIKRRTVANEACDNGLVTVNGKPARASYEVKVGDEISLRFGVRTVTVEVLSVQETVRQAEASALYREIGEAYRRLDAWSMYMITAYEDAERYIGRKADKNRKIYNGMLKTYFYQYLGPKPPRRQKQET